MNRFWENRSPRENALALAVLGLILFSVASLTVRRGIRTLDDLNSRIETLERELLISHQHLAQSEEVEEAFREVAAAHSSRLSKAEIHDHLRREIYRLALQQPGAADDPPEVRTQLRTDYLVRIPVLREGVLNEYHEGYREYEIGFRVPSETIDDILLFLERLQTSDQLLRVDVLDIARPSHMKAVSASFEVTRTVIDRPEGDADELTASNNLVQNPSLEAWEENGDRPLYWTVEGCSVRKSVDRATHGALAMEVESTTDRSRLYQTRALERNERYLLSLDLTAESTGVLGVLDVEGRPIGQRLNLVPDGRPYRYEIVFETPWAPGPKSLVTVPNISLDRSAGSIVLDNVRLRKLED